jgi:hypothetical protein
MLYIIAYHVLYFISLYSFHIMQAIGDEAPKEVPTDENPTLEVVDEPLPEPLQGRHPSIPNLTFADNVPKG